MPSAFTASWDEPHDLSADSRVSSCKQLDAQRRSNCQRVPRMTHRSNVCADLARASSEICVSVIAIQNQDSFVRSVRRSAAGRTWQARQRACRANAKCLEARRFAFGAFLRSLLGSCARSFIANSTPHAASAPPCPLRFRGASHRSGLVTHCAQFSRLSRARRCPTPALARSF